MINPHKHGLETCTLFFSKGYFFFFLFHCILWHFVSIFYWKHQVSSPVMMLSNISSLFKRLSETWSQHGFCSSVKIQVSIFKETFLIHKSSDRICHNISVVISFVIICTFNLQCENTKICPHLHFWLPIYGIRVHIFLTIFVLLTVNILWILHMFTRILF